MLNMHFTHETKYCKIFCNKTNEFHFVEMLFILLLC